MDYLKQLGLVFLKHLDWTLISLGLAMIGAGDKWSLPLLQSLGVMLIGLVVLAVAMQPFWFRDRQETSETGKSVSGFESLAMIFRRASFLLFGLVISLIGLLGCLFSRKGLSEYFSQYPEIIIVAVSTFCFTIGAANTLTCLTEGGSWLEILKSIPARLFNLFLAASGMAGMILGLLHLFAPAEFTRLAKAVFK